MTTSSYTVYRGVSASEATDVLAEQRYYRSERVCFAGTGLGAGAVFGDGAYFVEDFELAAQYAFLHAIRENDAAAVLSQTLTLRRPLLIDSSYPEKRLRADVLRWRLGTSSSAQADELIGAGDIRLADSVKKYVLHLQHDGIVVLLPTDSRYFISYFAAEQVSAIHLDCRFTIEDALHWPFCELRKVKGVPVQRAKG